MNYFIKKTSVNSIKQKSNRILMDCFQQRQEYLKQLYKRRGEVVSQLNSIDSKIKECINCSKAECKHIITHVSNYDQQYLECKLCGLNEYNCLSHDRRLASIANEVFK